MKEYHKIQTVFLRDPETKYKTLLMGEWAKPEFQYLAENEWVFTEKVDGTNIRVMFDGEKITFGGKTDRAMIPAKLVEHLNGLFLPQVDRFKEQFPDGVCIYGEGYGAGIQNGGDYCNVQEFVVFDIKIGNWWLERDNVESIAEEFDCCAVPIVGSGMLSYMVELVREGFESAWGTFTAEGIVARPTIELKARNGERIITKLKHKDFPHE